jgi:hypothetical protein
MGDRLREAARTVKTGALDVWPRHLAAQELANRPEIARRNAAYICERLEGIHFNPSPSLVPIRPILLDTPVRLNLDSSSRYLVSLLHRVCWSLTDDPADLARRVGLRPEQVPLLGAAGAQHEIEFSTCNGRLDVLLQRGVPIFLEANFSAANVDPIVTHFQLAAYRTMYGLEPTKETNAAGEPFEGRARLFRKILRERQAPESVAVVGSVPASDVGDIRYYEAEPNYLRDRGFVSDLVDPSYFASSPPAGRYSIALKHYLSEYWMELGLPVDRTIAAHADTVFLVPDSGRSLSSKLVFAWLSAGSVPLSDADRGFVDRHIPWTRLFGPENVEFDGRTWRLPELAVTKQDDFVLKPLTSCGGKGVVLGRSTDADLWRRCVDEALDSRDHVLQLYVEADRLAMDFFDRKAGTIHSTDVTYVLGCYVVDGGNAGSTIRHFPHNAPGVVNLDRGASFNAVF